MRAKKLRPRREIHPRIRIDSIRRHPLASREDVISIIRLTQALPVRRHRLAHDIRGSVRAHARPRKGIDVGEEQLEGVDGQEGLSADVLLQVDDDPLEAGGTAAAEEGGDRVVEGVERVAVLVEAGDAEDRGGCGVEEVAYEGTLVSRGGCVRMCWRSLAAWGFCASGDIGLLFGGRNLPET